MQLKTSKPDLHQVDLLSEEQIPEFKRDGFLVLPGVLDTDLCRQARDQMWEVIAEHRPGMKRDDPASWTPISAEEAESYQRPAGGATLIFSAKDIAIISITGPRNYCLIWRRARCGASRNNSWA